MAFSYSSSCPIGMANKRSLSFTASFPLYASTAATQAGVRSSPGVA